MKRKRGLFISLEGGEGSGKSTQLLLIKKYLSKKGYRVITTIEPGGTDIGNQIRAILLSPANKKMAPLTELFLYLASRTQIVQEVIKPALKQGKAVICDRYIDSSVAYQGKGRKLGMDMVERFNHIATRGLEPDLTFFFDINPILGLSRKTKSTNGKMDRLEKERIAFHQEVRQGYITLAKKYPQRIKYIMIREKLSPKKIFQQIQKEIDRFNI
jgi:dTMP kinase